MAQPNAFLYIRYRPNLKSEGLMVGFLCAISAYLRVSAVKVAQSCFTDETKRYADIAQRLHIRTRHYPHVLPFR